MAEIVRAVTLPIWKPVDLSWNEFMVGVHRGWDTSTALANWCVQRLFRVDDILAEKTPACVKHRTKKNPKGCYLYEIARKEFPKWKEATDKIAAGANCVIQAVHKKYLTDRYSIVVRKESSLLTYRYPYPFPVHNQTWDAEFDETGPVVSFNLPGIGKVRVRLKCGKEFRRQLGLLRAVVDGVGKKGEAAIYRTRKGEVMFKVVGTFQSKPCNRSKFENACFLHTDPNAFIIAEVNGCPVSISNGDHIKVAVARHKAFLQRAGEDKKREVRMDPQQRRNLNLHVDERCVKQGNRVKTYLEQVTSQVARFCERRRVGVVVYDDSNREFIPDGFPWYNFGVRLCHKLEERGIAMVSRQNLNPKEFEEWRSNPTLVGAVALAGQRLVAIVKKPEGSPSVTVVPTKKSSPTVPICPTPHSAKSSRTVGTTPKGHSGKRAPFSEG